MVVSRVVLCGLWTLVGLFLLTDAVIELDHVSTIYIPYSYRSSPRYDIDSDAVEQVAFDAAEGIAYVVGDDYLQIVDYADVENPNIIQTANVRLMNRANDIAHCGPFVAYVLQGYDSQETGTLYVHEKYNRQTKTFTQIHHQEVNSQPEMLTFTPDCRKILTADEGTAGDDREERYFLNPEGRVSIIKINGDFSNPTFETTNVGFNDFDARRQKYLDLGVRFPYNGRYNNYTEQTLSQSVEPEYIAINPRSNVAYINLQENNAIAILDLNTESIVEIVPLGTKSWANLGIDASDRDDAINLQTGYDIKSFYMPDAIKYFEIDGVGYIAAADEGSDLDYRFDGTTWGDASRGRTIHYRGKLASTVSQALKDDLSNDNRLGRLEFSITDGLSETEPGKIEELFFFGARGFSILEAQHLTRVYESGDEIERLVAERYPAVFNSETYPDEEDQAIDTPHDLVDKRSDNRGPECETVEVGVVNGQTVVFVGVDHASVIAIYTVAAGGQATLQSLHRRGGMNQTFAQLLEDRNLGDLDPKDMEFVSAEQSPTNRPLLMVAGSKSGTLSLYHVIDSDGGDVNKGAISAHGNGCSAPLPSTVLLVSLISLVMVVLNEK